MGMYQHLAHLSDEEIDRLDKNWERRYSETGLPEGFFENMENGRFKLRFDKLPSNHRLNAPASPSLVRMIESYDLVKKGPYNPKLIS